MRTWPPPSLRSVSLITSHPPPCNGLGRLRGWLGQGLLPNGSPKGSRFGSDCFSLQSNVQIGQTAFPASLTYILASNPNDLQFALHMDEINNSGFSTKSFFTKAAQMVQLHRHKGATGQGAWGGCIISHGHIIKKKSAWPFLFIATVRQTGSNLKCNKRHFGAQFAHVSHTQYTKIHKAGLYFWLQDVSECLVPRRSSFSDCFVCSQRERNKQKVKIN